MKNAFHRLKKLLLKAFTLIMPDIYRPLHLYIDENKGIAKTMLTQTLVSWKRPTTYMSKELDLMTQG